MAVHGSERTGNVDWQRNRLETSMRLGLARLEAPTDRARVVKIIDRSGLPEMVFFAKTLVTNNTRYAVDSLGWSLDDANRNDISIDPDLAKAVKARLERRGR